MGLILEAHRLTHPDFEYHLFFSDVDLLSLEQAKRALYSKLGLSRIPQEFHRLVLIGSGKSSEWMTLSAEIRKRSIFRQNDMSQMTGPIFRDALDFVLCRNVLIYFKLVLFRFS